MKEFGRKTIHILGGLFILVLLALLGENTFAYLSIPLLIFGLVSVQFEVAHFNLPGISTIFKMFERKNVMPGKGAIWYWISVLVALAFFNSQLRDMAIICLSIGDGFATIIGRIGKIKNPINKTKSLEGSAAFAISSLCAYALFYPITLISILFIVCATIIEAAKIPFDDNLRISLLCFPFLLFF